MKLIHAQRHWVFSLVAAVLLVGGAATLAQRTVPPDPAGPVIAGNEVALSTVFRDVAKEVLPSIVSIETRGKSTQLTGGQLSPFNDEDLPAPFRRFFDDDPQLRDLFRGRGAPQTQPERRLPGPRGMGSGFIIGDGLILTNSHVVRDAEEVKVRLHDGRELVATDVRTDPRTDVAVVRLDGVKGLKPIRLGDSDQMQIGDWVLAVGTPFGLPLSVTHGIISAKGRGPGITEREDFLQTDAPINPGNSGGPLVNLRGEAIGINTAISTRGGGSNGVGFTIPINMAKWVADQLASHGQVKRAYLGVSIQPIDQVLAKQFHVETGRGALVSQVVPGSPADDAKLQAGDVILELNGTSIDGPRALQSTVEQLTIGRTYPLVVIRNGEKTTLHVEAREMPQDYSRSSFREEAEKPEKEAPQDSRFDNLGLGVRELTPETARELGVTATKGVVVTQVDPDSPAGLVGVAKGDVILEVNRKKIASKDDFAEAMKTASVKDGVLMLVQSGRSTRYLSIQVR